MVLDAGTIIRAGSGALFALLGFAIFALSRGTRRPLALGGLLSCMGSVLVLNNLAPFSVVTHAYLAGALFFGAGVSGFVLATVAPRPMTPRERPAIWIGLAVGAGFASGMFSHGVTLDGMAASIGLQGLPPVPLIVLAAGAGLGLLGITSLGAIVSTRVAISPPTDRAGWIQAAALVAVIDLYGSFAARANFNAPTSVWSLAAALSFTLGLTIPWLVAAVKTGHRATLLFALVWPTLGLAGSLYLLLPVNQDSAFFDAFGLYGVLRIIGWTFLVYAILRANLLGIPLPQFAVSRGAVAAGALALLFIVAQIAQNFLSAEYGLLTGGIIAGTFLFAANPVQKVFERMGERKSTPNAPGQTLPAVDAGRREAAFRDAVRLAWKDRRFERDEEVALANLADTLGVTAMRATEIRHDVEREKGGA